MTQSASVDEQLDQLLEPWQRRDAPGPALAVLRDGVVVAQRCHGMANLEHGVPIAPTTVFDAASVAKQFAGCAIAMLEHAGRLSLDDDVRHHLPDLPDFGTTITVRDLLHHTSGIWDWIAPFRLAGVQAGDVIDEAHIRKLTRRLRVLNFPPGTEHLYSNTNYNLLAEIIERVTGTPYAQWVREQVFDPLGMTRTRADCDVEAIIPECAAGYRAAHDGSFRQAPGNLNAPGSSSLCTTIEDLAKWAANFEHPRIIGRPVLERMRDTGVLRDGRSIDYAFGLKVTRYRGQPVIEHAGWWRGHRAQFCRFPEQRFAVLVLCNLQESDPPALAQRIADLYLAEAFTEPVPASPAADTPAELPPPASLTHAEVAALTGRYDSPELGTSYRATCHDSTLILQHARSADMMFHRRGECFVTEQGPKPRLRPSYNTHRQITGLMLSCERARHIHLRKVD